MNEAPNDGVPLAKVTETLESWRDSRTPLDVFIEDPEMGLQFKGRVVDKFGGTLVLASLDEGSEEANEGELPDKDSKVALQISLSFLNEDCFKLRDPSEVPRASTSSRKHVVCLSITLRSGLTIHLCQLASK
ncbi:MAG: hypothetical protein WCF57_04350 [Pyrinomonadaceae bacterium]